MPTTNTVPLLNTWLGQVGFTRGNPFATNEADREGMLSEYFVDTGEYEIIKGHVDQPQTTLVFAPRGGGKSAHRVMLASQCRPLSKDSSILAIPHLEFDALLHPNLTQAEIIDEHINSILRKGCESVLKACTLDSDLASQVPKEQRGLLSFFCKTFNPHLLGARSLKDFFAQMTLSQVYADRPAFQRAVAEHTITDQHELSQKPIGFHSSSVTGLAALLKQQGIQNHPSAQLLAELVDEPPEAVEFTYMLAAFKLFVDMIRAIGLKVLYVLVDRVDELPATANDPARAAALIEPLVMHLPLMETPGAAFKFFLPVELHPHLSFRPDRLQLSQIEWDAPRLHRLLEDRLVAFSEGKVSSLAQISAPPLADIDDKLVNSAKCSPRRLLVTGNDLLLAHCRRPQITDLLTSDDWIAVFGQSARVRVSRNKLFAIIEGKQISLTSLEHKFLASLLNHDRECDKGTLYDEVWGSLEGISDQAISRLVLRLRQKIEANPAEPQHLITDRGRGFRLVGVEWND